MDGANDGKFMPLPEEGIPESAEPQTAPADLAMDILSRKSFAGAEKFSLAMERFSALSTEMITLLMGLSQEINNSAEELSAVRIAVDLKKQEFERLREAEQSAKALVLQLEDLGSQRKDLEGLIAGRHAAWEAEKAQHAREEEDRRNAWNAEQFRARQELEEELRAVRQRNLEAQEAVERDLAERDLILKNKEVEWRQLIQELDQFLNKLAGTLHPRALAPAAPFREEEAKAGSFVPGISGPPHFGEDAGWSEGRFESEPDRSREATSMWENFLEERDSILDDRSLVLAPESMEDPGSSQPFSRDFSVLQNRKIEDAAAEPSAKREIAPLKFAPKKSNGLA